jgi:hypothetical protein
MSILPTIRQTMQSLGAVGLALCMATGCKPSGAPTGAAKHTASKTNDLGSATNYLTLQANSVFEQLLPPKGRDPFYPNSHRRDVVAAPVGRAEKPPPASELVLKGVVGAPRHRLAVINNAILGAGEEGPVRVPSGHLRVKCLEIGENYAVVKADGEIQTRRLVLARKGF